MTVGLLLILLSRFIGAKPDGKVCDHGETGILEVKCPYSVRNFAVTDAIDIDTTFVWNYVMVNFNYETSSEVSTSFCVVYSRVSHHYMYRSGSSMLVLILYVRVCEEFLVVLIDVATRSI